MRIAIIYDCLYPNTIGGAERWYRRLADDLNKSHKVTYITRKQWSREGPETAFQTIAVSPGGNLYKKSGRRGAVSPVLFGLGVFWHLLRKAHRYDIVDCATFPYFSMLGAVAALTLRGKRKRLVVDWHECWTKAYWFSYIGAIGGRIGYLVQAICVKVAPPYSIVISAFTSRRVRELGYRGRVEILPGLYDGPADKSQPKAVKEPPVVVFAGRHIPEKRVTLIPAVVEKVREEIPNLRAKIFGDGPDHGKLKQEVAARGLEEVVECPGFVDQETLRTALESALCFLLPSAREGYGLVVVESAALGVPVIVTEAEDSAAADLIENGVNGLITKSAATEEIAEKVVAAYHAGAKLRESTAEWFNKNASQISMTNSISVAEHFFTAIANGEVSP